MIIAISSTSTTETRPLPHSYKDKVELYHERFVGWKFNIANQLINEWKDNDGKLIPGIPHSGYAVLDIIFSYFESLGKHLEGFVELNPKVTESGKHFKIGIRALVDFSGVDSTDIDTMLTLLWSGVRCGLYHTGMTKSKIIITGNIDDAIGFSQKDQILAINPHKLPTALITHITQYRDHLLNEGEHSQIGKNFTKRYDFENR